MNKIINNDFEYSLALEEIETLMDKDPEPESFEGKKLHWLSLLIKDYEKDLEINQLPDPIEAIKFRMEQEGLIQRDLVPYIGSRSKVSEVMARKRPLTLDMVRALSANLGIPAKVLVQESQSAIDDNNLDWEKFPAKEIIARKWLNEPIKYSQNKNGLIVNSFINQLQPVPKFSAFYRSNHNYRSGRTMDIYGLYLWNIRILLKAKEIKSTKEFKKDLLTTEVLRNLVKLSKYDDGPLRAFEYLLDYGIRVVVEPHLSRTYLDGAVILTDEKKPVIGLTIRYDRIDNFWFTLIHELAHIFLHSHQNIEIFYDDLDIIEDKNFLETEADEFAREILIPKEEWIKTLLVKVSSLWQQNYLLMN